jgi:hypothetical protein
MLESMNPHEGIIVRGVGEFDAAHKLDRITPVKHLSHLYRMNPQTTRRTRNVPRLSTILVALFLATLAALYWIGKLHGR